MKAYSAVMLVTVGISVIAVAVQNGKLHGLIDQHEKSPSHARATDNREEASELNTLANRYR